MREGGGHRVRFDRVYETDESTRDLDPGLDALQRGSIAPEDW